MRRRRSPRILLVAAALIIVLGLFLFLRLIFYSPSQEVTRAVDRFYQYEQAGDFAKSWELFHPVMKMKFSKGVYIQDRAHVFMNHFGVETFQYTFAKPEKIKGWKMSKDSETFKLVYKVPVVQEFRGKYGHFDIHQDVFVVEGKDGWMVLWDYNQ
ncbi:hypothetical protein [Bacillus sp. 03113]|uniref:hypothetical protein n=1 Tax=Bacillus sp. 03113 TaxID=2578211 RepID=UPI001143C826|nr:hypothetical protein [Bacillus sp. 03113]